MTCFLDMDGVLTDFVGTMALAHGKENPFNDPDEPVPYHIEELWGLSAEDFWKPANSLEFWSTMAPTAHKSAVLELVYDYFGQENVFILTSPSASPHATAGKVMWIQKNVPELARQFFVGPKKEALARPGAFLIDDHEVNVEKFKAAGGGAAVWPTPASKAWFGREDPVSYVAGEIEVYDRGWRGEYATERTGDPEFHRLLEEMAVLHDRKQADYGTDGDAFANYRSGELWNVPAWQNAMMRVDEKMNRIRAFLRNGDLQNESIDDAFLDTAVGAVIGYRLYKEERGDYEG